MIQDFLEFPVTIVALVRLTFNHGGIRRTQLTEDVHGRESVAISRGNTRLLQLLESIQER